MVNSKGLGKFNIGLGIFQVMVPLLQARLVIPKVQRMYEGIGLTNDFGWMNTLAKIVVAFGVVNIALGLRLIKGTKSVNLLKFSLWFAVSTLLAGGIMVAVSQAGFLNSIYSLTSDF